MNSQSEVAALPAKWRAKMPSQEELYGDWYKSGQASAYDVCVDELDAALAQDRASQAGAAVPDGWQLVPRVLTIPMIEAFEDEHHKNYGNADAAWACMLSVAPTPAAED